MRTITLTNRPPVKINEDNWPKIASADDYISDGEYHFQSFRHTKYWLTVRQHEDGRTIVYAVYDHDTVYQTERSEAARRGVLLNADQATTDQIVEAIREVASDMPLGDLWDQLADECIASLPAETLD
jgi:hypothetical protein